GNGSTQRILAVFDTDSVHIGIENIDGAVDGRVGEVVDLIETGGHEEAQIQDKHSGHRNQQFRKDDVKDNVFSAGSVQSGGFVNIGTDADNGGVEDNGVPAKASPGFTEHQYPTNG